mgnify:CR=1 FL=1
MTRAQILKELFEIQQWLKANDWKVNKFVLGEWAEDDPRWIEYLTTRAEKRARQDLLNFNLKGAKK